MNVPASPQLFGRSEAAGRITVRSHERNWLLSSADQAGDAAIRSAANTNPGAVRLIDSVVWQPPASVQVSSAQWTCCTQSRMVAAAETAYCSSPLITYANPRP